MASKYLKQMFKPGDKKIFDEAAVTIEELQKELLEGKTGTHAFARRKVLDGEWEQVWKHTGKRIIPAYRPKK